MRPHDIALQEYATQEILGEKHNPRILEYFKQANNAWVQNDETAWCAAFVAFCLKKTGLTSTDKLNARSYLTWGEETRTPQVGDIVVFWRGSKNGWQGHVAFYVNENADYIRVLGGNQGNAVSIEKYPKNQLLSYRKVPQNATVSLDSYSTGHLLKEVIKRFEHGI